MWVPLRIIDITQNFYDGSRCAVRHGGDSGVGWGRGTVVPGSRAKGHKIGDQKYFLKLFLNTSQLLSLVRLGHRHSINQSNRLQLTKMGLSIYDVHKKSRF